MKMVINKGVVYFTGSLEEEAAMVDILGIMSGEISTLTCIEHFGNDCGYEMTEITLCYSADEATVQTLRESYSDAKHEINNPSNNRR